MFSSGLVLAECVDLPDGTGAVCHADGNGIKHESGSSAGNITPDEHMPVCQVSGDGVCVVN